MAVITKKKKEIKTKKISKKTSDYQKYVVEPAKRLLSLIDNSEVNNSPRSKSA